MRYEVYRGKMARMTIEEATALSDFIANNFITLGPNGSDWLSQREIRISGLSNVTVLSFEQGKSSKKKCVFRGLITETDLFLRSSLF